MMPNCDSNYLPMVQPCSNLFQTFTTDSTCTPNLFQLLRSWRYAAQQQITLAPLSPLLRYQGAKLEAHTPLAAMQHAKTTHCVVNCCAGTKRSVTTNYEFNCRELLGRRVAARMAESGFARLVARIIAELRVWLF